MNYTLKVQEMTTNGILLGTPLNMPVNITMHMNTDGSWKVSAPDNGTFATGSTRDEAIEKLVEELEFLFREGQVDGR